MYETYYFVPGTKTKKTARFKLNQAKENNNNTKNKQKNPTKTKPGKRFSLIDKCRSYQFTFYKLRIPCNSDFHSLIKDSAYFVLGSGNTEVSKTERIH